MVNREYLEQLRFQLKDTAFSNETIEILDSMNKLCSEAENLLKNLLQNFYPNEKVKFAKFRKFAAYLKIKIYYLLKFDRKCLKFTEKTLRLEEKESPDKDILKLLKDELILDKFVKRDEEKIFAVLMRCFGYLKNSKRSIEELKKVFEFTIKIFLYIQPLIIEALRLEGQKAVKIRGALNKGRIMAGK